MEPRCIPNPAFHHIRAGTMHIGASHSPEVGFASGRHVHVRNLGPDTVLQHGPVAANVGGHMVLSSPRGVPGGGGLDQEEVVGKTRSDKAKSVKGSATTGGGRGRGRKKGIEKSPLVLGKRKTTDSSREIERLGDVNEADGGGEGKRHEGESTTQDTVEAASWEWPPNLSMRDFLDDMLEEESDKIFLDTNLSPFQLEIDWESPPKFDEYPDDEEVVIHEVEENVKDEPMNEIIAEENIVPVAGKIARAEPMGRRWNLVVSRTLRSTVYEPALCISAQVIGRKWASLPAVMSTFVVSALMHEILFYYMGRLQPTWEVTRFFLLHGSCVVAEIWIKKLVKDRWRLPRLISTPMSVGFVMVTVCWLFIPQLLRCKIYVRASEEYAVLGAFVKDVAGVVKLY
ncbi:hypothetical protein RHGRI_004252 [Rhododendron griersonianum]|uniref:Wax synthase domain-containing protein n=1 Tax=Rhododendron griersonianum TaxID=479676 RepID=A0AAV6L8R8_9ERIC|nr:hypothetical protein RHGRI_004252 [Rhododendron griersonianum]